MKEPHIRGTTRRELLGGAAVVLSAPVLGFRAGTPDPWSEEPDGNCGTGYDEEYEELLTTSDEPDDVADISDTGDVSDFDRVLGVRWARPLRRRARVTMRYRVRGNWLAGYHTGVDLAVPKGTPVYSVGSGTVVLARWSGAYGNAVTIKMQDSRYVLYAHLSRISVVRGAKVKAGTRIGKSGATGRATGPHLHFEVRSRRRYGSDIDPVKYLARHGLHL